MQDNVSGLTQLGSTETEFRYCQPSVSMLETFPNKYPERDYGISHETEEFTSLCPRTGQPDFARVSISYIADKLCVETKSLKLYLFAYRSEGAFMETICNRVSNDLVAVLLPRRLAVTMTFRPRGGIETSVSVDYKGVQ